VLLALCLATPACEDGPEQIFVPNTATREANGDNPLPPYVLNQTQGFDIQSGDAAGRARFCDETETNGSDSSRWVSLTRVIPDVSVGTVPLWDAVTGTPTFADDLIGRPEEGKFCDPWSSTPTLCLGPGLDLRIIVFFNADTGSSRVSKPIRLPRHARGRVHQDQRHQRAHPHQEP